MNAFFTALILASAASAPRQTALPQGSRLSALDAPNRCDPMWLRAFGGQTPNDLVYSLVVLDAGGGPALYAGGGFTRVGSLQVNRIAKWDGASWSALGSGMGGATPASTHVDAMLVFDDGSGPALYAGGSFTSAGGQSALGLARWDGAAWTPVGGGVSGHVKAMAVFDDGGGPALHVAGSFARAGGVLVRGIAKWDGASWTPLGAGLTGSLIEIRALAVGRDRTGPLLYAGGLFESIDRMPANNIAAWNGTEWSLLGGGVNDGVNEEVDALTVFDDGSGPALYVGGGFTAAGGAPAGRIARWDGTHWSSLGTGATAFINFVYAITAFDDGAGPDLYAAGFFGPIGGNPGNCIARWDGAQWSPLDQGFRLDRNEAVTSLAVFDGGSGPELYAGGNFPLGPIGERHLTRWVGCAATIEATRLTPNQGPIAGGNTAKLLGTGFVPGTSVTFAGAPGLVSWIDAGELLVTVPARGSSPADPGQDSVDVVVTSPFGGRDTLEDGYSYVQSEKSSPPR